MKTKITVIIAALLMATNFSFAQQNENCMLNLTLMNDYVKNKKYDQAYEPFMSVRKECPKFNLIIYKFGEKVLNHKIDNSSGAEKEAFIEDYIALLNEAGEHFPSKYAKGEVLEGIGILLYDNQELLNKSDMDVYNAFDNAFKQDLKNFTSTKGLYVYFTKTVDLFKAKEIELQQVFDKYDDVSEQLENLNEGYTKSVNELIEKEEAGTALKDKEALYKKYYLDKLEANGKISGSLDSYLGQLANCENLIPLYKKQYEEKYNDAVWLKRAVSRMYNKECTEDPLYIELVKKYDEVDPSADTKYFVSTILREQGKIKEADQYVRQSFDLQTDKFKKARLAKRIAAGFKNRGDYSTARNYYRDALELNPSDGTPHLHIASMYAKSANSCGDDNFNKRAVFWYAAQEARKAGQVDPNLRSNSSQAAASYEANAPTRSEIFTKGNGGSTINIGCWIGGSVVVPKVD
ncbi:tetratricopeptide repeat protein [Subsaximicrobium wynnwilliamsii]|uniref:Tetratricopeptide repeat protein n=1 Tax=Subsaximicrobium wynnwilliamsii TaxID=291179 RepID=A0A5C6ZGI7_9FLAO|nr:tetratricopeptide repeat protein [Subsaximicrobium wynnwilliamsii]TXD83502.1 tetratricopeptide repeat protein [Subsaximicrobium wynnwilliamsii]TXD89223.1 tetratricopeptide repeat protein [Subsaximicrobium wynnwilliamsii]TXE03182.1 tetratricopeptide repeat protein [Subsaximicrobium wynnwilliamsii]